MCGVFDYLTLILRIVPTKRITLIFGYSTHKPVRYALTFPLGLRVTNVLKRSHLKLKRRLKV
ncbi:hypothetical protein MJ1HA_1337 [Metallosphaera sedula]|nr:hypothetical protein MJ1HA_1337 [Metallosphaera sedula]